MLRILAWTLCYAWSATALSKTLSYPGWLAYGDLRGYIEPCGCDPRTDLGGVQRLSTMINQDRHNNLIFDLGNNFSEKSADATKNLFINEALRQIGADAALINSIEFQNLSLLDPKRTFVLSNLRSTKKGTVLSSVRRGSTAIFGYLWIDGTQKNLMTWKDTFNAVWQKQAATLGLSRKILLFSGPEQHLHEIATSGLFDEIISANRASMTALMTDEEKQKPGLLLRLSAPQEVFQVPLGAQGVLRGGEARKSSKKTLTELMNSSPTAPLRTGINLSGDGEIVTWLTPPYGIESPLEGMMLSYKKAREKEFVAIQAQRLAFLKDSPFAGADLCRTCHEADWQVWRQSRHSVAYESLTKKGKHEDEECASCHVLGLSQKGGFVSLADSPNFAGVQCENCHGPGAAHSRNPTIKMAPANQAVCTTCHHPPHSSSFDFSTYWPKIMHGQKPR